MKNRIYISCLVFTLLIVNSYSYSQAKDSVSYNKLAIIGGLTGAAFIYSYAIQNTIWWKGTKSNFHFNFNQDWKYAMGSDKYGHLFFGAAITNTYSNFFEWSGMEKKDALKYSAILAFSYQTFIEIRDGFSKDYGFSWGDLTANFFGALYPNLQLAYPFLQNINFKISYFPSERFKNGSNRYLIDDYESTYNWITVNLNYFTPREIKPYVPEFINIAIGHSVKQLNINSRHHEIYLSLDWSFKKLKSNNKLLNALISLLEMYHFPAPAIKIYPDVIWYGLKF